MDRCRDAQVSVTIEARGKLTRHPRDMRYGGGPAEGELFLMRLPAALIPLRNGTFRTLWLATVVGWLGTWLQNTGAGWLMTSLAPRPMIVAMVQAATIMPVFLLALPGGALTDIVDRRIFLIGAQVWTF